jgi:predicted permease
MAIASVRSSLRFLRSHPGFSVVVLTTLAVGIGATTAMFSIFNAMVLRPLPYSQPERLVWLTAAAPGGQETSIPVSYPDFLDWRRQATVFSAMAAFSDQRLYLTGGEVPERISGSLVSPELFTTLGVQPRFGRAFSSQEGQPGGPRVALIGYELWQRRFAAQRELLGRPVEINHESFVVIGVMPPRFRFPEYAEMWLPLSPDPATAPRDRGSLYGVARLRRGVGVGGAQRELSEIAKRLAQEYAATNPGRGALVVPLRRYYVGDTALAAVVFLAATGLVLLVACANLASLLLARSVSRQREISVRAALGASRGRLVGQLLTESLVLAVLGAVPGLALAVAGLRVLVRSIPIVLPFWADFSLDGRVLTFALCVALLAGILFGLAPALHASHLDLNQALREGPVGPRRSPRRRLHQLLVVAEVAVAVAVLICAGLMFRGFLGLQSVATGFRSAGVLSATAVPASSPLDLAVSAPRVELQRRRQAQTLEALGRLPGIDAAALASDLPLRGGTTVEFAPAGAKPPGGGSAVPSALLKAVSPQYFHTLGIPLRAGRDFDVHDDARAHLVAMVNETLAERFWPGGQALGKRFKLSRWDQAAPLVEVVGVAGNVRELGLASRVPPTVYVPLDQRPRQGFYLFLHSARDPASLAAALRAALREREPDLQVDSVKSLDQVVAESMWQPALYSWLLSIFATVALLLAAVGVYGMVSFYVSQRTREIGIRVALGARAAAVLKLVAGQVMLKVVVGILLGIALEVALGGLLRGALPGFSALDPVVPAGLAACFLAVSALASYLPARRALRVDPTQALRAE